MSTYKFFDPIQYLNQVHQPDEADRAILRHCREEMAKAGERLKASREIDRTFLNSLSEDERLAFCKRYLAGEETFPTGEDGDGT